MPKPTFEREDDNAVWEKHGNFEVSDEGVSYVGENGTRARIAARVDVVAMTRDSEGNSWGRLLRWLDAEGRVHEWAMPMEALARDPREVWAKLLSEGLSFISSDSAHRKQLSSYLQNWRTDKLARSVQHIGWHGAAYVLPNTVIGCNGEEQVLFQAVHHASHHWNTSGSATDWRNAIGRKCVGNSRLVLAVSCAFAGPLLSLLGVESGGIHFYGLSSTGKTTLLMVGGSVCGGRGKDGFLQSWRTTINGLEAIAEAHNDATLFLDELAQVDPYDAASTAYLLANGQGKNRMTKELGAARKLYWRLLFLSSGELTLADHAASAGKRTRGGAEVRLLNIEADAGQGLGIFENLHGFEEPDAFADKLKQLSRTTYGAPFRAFLERLTAGPEGAKRRTREIQRQFMEEDLPSEADGELRRAAKRFSLIAAAGELATDYDLTGWPQGAALEAAARCFRDWRKARGTAGSFDVDRAVNQVRHIIEKHSTRFQRGAGDRVANRLGFQRGDGNRTEYLFHQEAFKNEVCSGHDYRMVANALNERGHLRRQAPEWTVKTSLPGIEGQTRVFAVRASILQDK